MKAPGPRKVSPKSSGSMKDACVKAPKDAVVSAYGKDKVFKGAGSDAS